MPTDKKPWIRPQLIVLGRGRPEENVLQSCKDLTNPGSPNSNKCAKEGDYSCSAPGMS
jgi:hypothetical protein